MFETFELFEMMRHDDREHKRKCVWNGLKGRVCSSLAQMPCSVTVHFFIGNYSDC